MEKALIILAMLYGELSESKAVHKFLTFLITLGVFLAGWFLSRYFQ